MGCWWLVVELVANLGIVLEKNSNRCLLESSGEVEKKEIWKRLNELTRRLVIIGNIVWLPIILYFITIFDRGRSRKKRSGRDWMAWRLVWFWDTLTIIFTLTIILYFTIIEFVRLLIMPFLKEQTRVQDAIAIYIKNTQKHKISCLKICFCLKW